MGENKYKNGKIYKIVDVGYNETYVGSTCESLSQRMARHRNNYKTYSEGKPRYFRSFELFDTYGIENCKIELIEYFSCQTKEELLRREGEYIKTLDCVNKNIAGRTTKEYIQDTRDKINERWRTWYNTKKEKKQAKLREQEQEPNEQIK